MTTTLKVLLAAAVATCGACLSGCGRTMPTGLPACDFAHQAKLDTVYSPLSHTVVTVVKENCHG